MAVTSVVNILELEGAKRLDAEYYQQDYLIVERNIRKHPHGLCNKNCVNLQ